MADLMSATDVGQMAPGGSIVLPQRQNYGFSYISARPQRMRWTDSAMFNQEPLNGA